MNACRSIEPLIYLHRPGELSAEEQRTVDAHVASCPTCRKLLSELRALDEAVNAERMTAVERKPSLVNEFDERLTRSDHAPPRPLRGAELLWGFFRPAFVAALALAIGFLIIEVVQDGLQVSALERRLQSTGEQVRATTSIDDLQRWRALPPGTLNRPTELSRAAINPLDLLAPGLAVLFGNNNRLFERLERKYPGLSSITTDDGLDDRERAILATEGKAFLSEIEQLIRQGELQR